MGANLCSLRQPSGSERKRGIISSSSDHENVNNHGSWIINFMKPDCLKTEKINNKKRKHSPEKKITKAKKLTLEEWLMASPAGPKPECFLGGELHVFKNFSKTKRVYPTSSKRVHADVVSGPRDSLTLERLVKVDDQQVEDEWEVPSSIMSRSQSGKLKKKVSFKLPEEADIILFYSPPEEAI